MLTLFFRLKHFELHSKEEIPSVTFASSYLHQRLIEAKGTTSFYYRIFICFNFSLYSQFNTGIRRHSTVTFVCLLVQSVYGSL